MHCFLLQPAKRQPSLMLLLPASRNKGGCAEPVLKGGRERASAEGLCFGQTTLSRTPPHPDRLRGYRQPPKEPQGAFFALWSNEKYGFYKRSTFRSMFSLKSWRGASDHCKTAAQINHIMLENPSKNDVFFCVPPAVRGGIAYSSLSGCGERNQNATLLRWCYDFQQRTVVWEFCSAHAASRQNPPLSIEDSSKIRSVRFPLGLLPKSRIFVAGGAALALRN